MDPWLRIFVKAAVLSVLTGIDDLRFLLRCSITFLSQIVKQHAIKNREPRSNSITHISSINYEKSLEGQLTSDIALFDQGSDITYTCRQDLLTNVRQLATSCYFDTLKGKIKSSTVGTMHLN